MAIKRERGRPLSYAAYVDMKAMEVRAALREQAQAAVREANRLIREYESFVAGCEELGDEPKVAA